MFLYICIYIVQIKKKGIKKKKVVLNGGSQAVVM